MEPEVHNNHPRRQVVGATHCLICSRPLEDAVSVNCGIGPTCRERVGLDLSAMDPHMRMRANRLLVDMASDPRVTNIYRGLTELVTWNFQTLANRIATHFAIVRIVEEPQVYLVHTPYNEKFILSLKACIRVAHFKREKGKSWEIPKSYRKQIWEQLNIFFPNQLGVSPKGFFLLGSP